MTLLKPGTPFAIESGSDGLGFGNIDGREGDRPTLVEPSVLGPVVGSPDTSESQLPRSAFRYIDAPAKHASSLGRNTFCEGKIANVNASL